MEAGFGKEKATRIQGPTHLFLGHINLIIFYASP